MARTCSSCGKIVPRGEAIKIDGAIYCLECAANLGNKTKNKGWSAEFGVPDVTLLSVETIPVEITAYFQAISSEVLVSINPEKFRLYGEKDSPIKVVSLTYDIDTFKLQLMEDLKIQAGIVGANVVLGVKVFYNTISFIDDEKLLIVSMSGTPVLREDTSFIEHHHRK